MDFASTTYLAFTRCHQYTRRYIVVVEIGTHNRDRQTRVSITFYELFLCNKFLSENMYRMYGNNKY